MSVHKIGSPDALAVMWWPIARLGEAIEASSRIAGLLVTSTSEALAGPPWFKRDDIADWLDWAGDQLGIEAVSVDVAVPELTGFLQKGGPAIILYQRREAQGFVVLQASSGGEPLFLAPDHKLHRCSLGDLVPALCKGHSELLAPEINRILDAAAIDDSRRQGILSAMLDERLATERIDGIWILRLPAQAGIYDQLREARVLRKIVTVIGIFALIYALEILGWKLIGSAAIGGRLDFGWLAAWALLMFTMIPWRVLGGWFEAGFALDAGRILKSRLLAGALAMAPDSVKRNGIGHLISRVMESQALESLALNGGIAVAISAMELAFAAWILWHGAAGGVQICLLVAWTTMTVVLGHRYHRKLSEWSHQRLGMTHGLIEAMVGHRTRLAQQRADRRDASEDAMLNAYVDSARALDRAGIFAFSALPSGWMLAGIVALLPAFASGQAPSAASLAVSLGGMLVAQRAFAGIAAGLAGLARARFAWSQVSTLFKAPKVGVEERPFLSAEQLTGAKARKHRLIDAQGLSFRYARSEERVIDRADLMINCGDRILVEGPSGGGKSTLAACLTGLLQPESGLLLLNGLDRHTLGSNWNRLATAAPQFHENHILTGTIGFNLLMGRQWPASPMDLAEAESVCRELGLGELLDRMPGGINQRVGETGWQLSHGERSRIFLARALLQRVPLTIMDESFASLDPQTMMQCLKCALQRAETLVVIAHP